MFENYIFQKSRRKVGILFKINLPQNIKVTLHVLISLESQVRARIIRGERKRIQSRRTEERFGARAQAQHGTIRTARGTIETRFNRSRGEMQNS